MSKKLRKETNRMMRERLAKRADRRQQAFHDDRWAFIQKSRLQPADDLARLLLGTR